MNSHLTAISRKTWPVPTRWLLENNLITGRVLDYGCGKCAPLNPMDWDNYDPYHYPCIIRGGYDTILCNYVLCTLPPKERKAVLRMVDFYLKSDGKAYISVRSDKPRYGWGRSSKGTTQYKVRLSLPEIHKTSQYIIYLLTNSSKI